MKILVCDDEQGQCERTMRVIESRGEVEGRAGDELKRGLKAFFVSISAALDGAISADELEPEEFAGFDLAIVDNNLTGLELEGARLTAESIIGYLRAFTDIPYIVSLNKERLVDFDLRFLFGDYQSLGDLALNTPHLSSDCLWGDEPVTGFAPWYWPRLPDAAARRKRQVSSLAENLNESVWKALDFPPEADEYLSRRAREPLTVSGDHDDSETNFEAFFNASHALQPAEKDSLLARRADGHARRAIAHIAAYEVDRWLRRDILGTQDVLIDLPHLVAQMPFLLGEHASQLDAWNQAVRAERDPFGFDERLFRDHLEAARFASEIWAPVPCFWWPSLRSDEDLTELFFAAAGDWPDAVFCEDVSRFVPVAGDELFEPPREFEADIGGSWQRRYVAVEGDYLYSPRSHLGKARRDP